MSRRRMVTLSAKGGKELKRRLDRRNFSYAARAGVVERSELIALLEHAAEQLV
jgi:hypothetical protein